MFTVSVTVLDEIRQLTYIIVYVYPSTSLLDVVFVFPVPPAPPMLCILDIKKIQNGAAPPALPRGTVNQGKLFVIICWLAIFWSE